MPRSPRILFKLGLAVGALLVGLFVVEVALRVLGVSYPRSTEADAVLGVVHRPGAQYWQRDEGEALVRINAEGFRDAEWQVAKEPGQFRIAVLGDSYVEANQVPVEERFTELLERQLTAAAPAGTSVQVMNFGMSGYGTGQELLLLKHGVWKYQPDLVVLAFLTGNDLSDNCQSLRPHERRPFFELRDGQLVLNDSFLDWVASEQRPTTQALYTLADWSRIVQLLYRARKNVQARAAAARVAARGADAPRELGLDDEVYAEPQTPAWREAWELTERLLLEMAEEVRAHGARFLVVTLSNSDQVEPNPAVRDAYMQRLGVAGLFYPDQRIERFCAEHGIDVVCLAPALADYAVEHGVYLHGFENLRVGRGHWNAAGHRQAAELIGVHLLPKLPGMLQSGPTREAEGSAESSAPASTAAPDPLRAEP